MKTIKVLGNSDERLKEVEYGSRLNNFTVSEAVRFSSDRSSSNYEYLRDLNDDDVIELVFQDGIRRWLRVDELGKDYKYSLSRGEAEGVIEIPSQLPTPGEQQTSRGFTTWTLKALRVLKYDPVATAAKGIAEHWDGKLMENPGLYVLRDGVIQEDKKVTAGDTFDANKPILLFLHGTFSSTKGSFGGLPQEIWPGLHQKYGSQIYGFDHYTLSVSPIHNALELVRLLPENADLYLVTHSRGGLIGELLSRGTRTDGNDPFDEIDLKLAAAHLRTDAGEQDLRTLSNLLRSKNIRVNRLVRIACPARGTTVASGRLDKWLELIVNVVSKVMDPATRTLFGVLTDLLLDLKKQAANPDAIPGIASMVPESGFIRMINRPDVEVDASLCVIAGDAEKNDILGRLAIFFTDLFYYEDHDLVVQTRAMYGGAPRRNGLYFFHKGTDVNHFHYFSNRRTAEKIAEALSYPQVELEKKGFRLLVEAYQGQAVAEIDLVSRSFQKRSTVSQPVVYVVPGIMGTHLAVDGKRIWLDLFELARGRIMDLNITSRTIKPHSLVAMAYGNLVEYLSATHEVIPFPYDWRASILDEADRFAEVIQDKLEETKQPIRILAHSMGGLVTRAMIGRHPKLWNRICDRDGSRFVMLGTPNRGAHKIPRLILGQEKTLRMLAMLDVRNPPVRLLEVISRFPGVLQLLPMDDPVWDFLDENTWNRFPNVERSPWIKPRQADLDQAKRLQASLNGRTITPADPIAYVAGNAPGAPVGVNISDRGELQFLGTNEGDGTVTWKSGILPELAGRTWYMNVPHGDMANHRESFSAIYDLLQQGTTTRLSTAQPRVSRGVEDTYILPEEKEQPQIYPAQIDLEQNILGAAPVPLQAVAVEPVRVSIAHGNLSFCRDAVAVGHYQGDSLFSAEKELDHHLDGRLATRHRLGLYPGPEGTAEVVLNEAGMMPGGAIIVGLGKAGELSPHKLTQSFANAMRVYGLVALENNKLRKDGSLAVSTLLIGTGGMGLSVSNSVDAILKGVAQANKHFSQVEGPLQRVRISEVQFIELYQDQAILAARALRKFAGRPEFAREFAVDPRLRTLRGGWQRLTYIDPPGWWTRIHVRTTENRSLIFTVPTERARSEESQQDVQRSNIEGLLAQAVRNPQWNQSLATAMFELMIPNHLKGSFRDLDNILFVLDPDAAHYPWELIYDRRTGRDKPLVVQVGMIRQFSTTSFQERVVDVNNKNVLVVGNPNNLPDDFADLPGAQQEASLVEAKFREFGYDVTPQIQTGSNEIMNSLFEKDYRVLHLAGHGVYRYPIKRSEDEKPEVYTGMVLGGDVFLTANEIRNKMDIPELVFINCCHLGTIDNPAETTRNQFNKFAASLSQELIKMGVKAVIAAGWAVDDSAALTFAEEFYDHLLKGATFGEAVKAARQETYELHKDRTNTWAAYQCYGDPGYQLVLQREEGPRDGEYYSDIEEALVAIRKLSGSAKSSSVQGVTSLRERLIGMHSKLEQECPDWLKDSRLQEALGEAFGEVFWFDKAIDYYQLALKNENCNASVRTVEQLANFHIRQAVKTFEQDPNCYDDAKSKIEAQIKTLKSLMRTVGDSSERWSMIGSGYKRLARISADIPSDDCDRALEKMEEAYLKAWKKAEQNPYPLTNYLYTRLVRLLRSGDRETIAQIPADVVDQAKELARLVEVVKMNSSHDFWISTGAMDVKLIDIILDYMREGQVPSADKRSESLAMEYTAIWKRFGSPREINSIIEHYAFLSAVLKDVEPAHVLPEFLRRVSTAMNSVPE